jgi:4-amino-4-deoxy-L-arabinose transferase-like glycosyltransferase
MNEAGRAPALKPWQRIAALLLFAIHAFLAADTARKKSVTIDEYSHLPAGITYWNQRTFEMYHQNPPLVKMLAALPAMWLKARVDYSKSWSQYLRAGMPLNAWVFGYEFMYDNARRYHDIFFWSRMAVVGLSLLAGVVVLCWAKELFGATAGLIALALWAFCPNVLAHAGLVTTDLGAASVGFAATYAFWRWLRAPSWPLALLCGVLLGAAELTKFSMLMLLPIWIVLWLGRRPRPSFVQLAVLFAAGAAVINTGYAFEGSGRPLGSYRFLSRLLTAPRPAGAQPPALQPGNPWNEILLERQNRFAGTWLARIPVPLPRHYLEGFDEQKLESEGVHGEGYPVFLLGRMQRSGWWWYYFFALAVKVPLGTWLLSVLALAACILVPSARAARADEFALWVPAVVFLGVMSFLTDINLGVRYVLPIFPFWFVSVGRIGRWVETGGLRACALVAALLAWNVVETARFHPHHLAYFNALAGGPAGGHRYLIDSNLDWGQDLPSLRDWLRDHRGGARAGLAYFGNEDPAVAGVPFALAPPRRFTDLILLATKSDTGVFAARKEWMDAHADELRAWLDAMRARHLVAQPNDHPGLRSAVFAALDLREGPQPGLFAVSANLRAGMPQRVRDQAGSIWYAEQDAFAYFQKLTPIATAGYSIFIYDVTPEESARVRREMGLPAQ